MTREVIFSPEAEDDLLDIYKYVAAASHPLRAYRYAERIRTYCRRFSLFPKRGTQRDDLRPGLRITGFERRVTIAFHVTPQDIVIDRILYGGRNIDAIFADS